MCYILEVVRSIIKKLRLIIFPCRENDFQSRLLRRNFLFRLAVILFVLRIVVLPFYIRFPKSSFFAKIVSSDILQLLNAQRKSQGLTVLKENPKLSKAALLKARDMFEQGYFGHKSPKGIPGWYWIQKSGYHYELAGENLGIGFLDSEEVYQAWYDSPQHRENLFNPDFQDIGIAVVKGEFQGNETTIVVQLFGRPKEKAETIAKTEITGVGDRKEGETSTAVRKIERENESEVMGASERTKEPEGQEKAKEEKESKKTEISETKKTEISETISPSFQFGFWEFLITKYSEIIQKTIFLIAFLIFFVLIINIVLIIRLPLSFGLRTMILKEFMPGTFLVIGVLFLLGFFDKLLLIQFIPHTLKI